MSDTTTEFKTRKFQLLFVIVLLIFLAALNEVIASQDKANSETAAVVEKKVKTEVFPVPPPLVYQGLYPCQACHRKDIRGVNSQLEKGKSFLGKYIRIPDPRPRTLVRMHRNISLEHAEWHWCLNCHSTFERNNLRLITGENISFEQSYRLCGQCHGSIYKDWKLGIHGRRVGQWNGKKLYVLCAHCHDPHKPKFRKLPAKDPPKPSAYGRWEAVSAHH
jgi:hypothetical protein